MGPAPSASDEIDTSTGGALAWWHPWAVWMRPALRRLRHHLADWAQPLPEERRPAAFLRCTLSAFEARRTGQNVVGVVVVVEVAPSAGPSTVGLHMHAVVAAA